MIRSAFKSADDEVHNSIEVELIRREDNKLHHHSFDQTPSDGLKNEVDTLSLYQLLTSKLPTYHTPDAEKDADSE